MPAAPSGNSTVHVAVYPEDFFGVSSINGRV